MMFKNPTVLVQLLFVIVVVAVLATHFRVFQVNELYSNPIQGAQGSDKNVILTGTIGALGAPHYIGLSQFPDSTGKIVIQPGLKSDKNGSGSNEIELNGPTILSDTLCFKTPDPITKQVTNRCYNARTLDAMGANEGKYVLNEQKLHLKGRQDENNVLEWNREEDGPRLTGWRSGALGTTERGYIEAMRWDKDGVRLKGDREIEFGAGETKERSAGKIKYGGDWDKNALNIVGAGQEGKTRVTRVWDALKINDAIFRQDGDWVSIIGNKDDPHSYNKGLKAKNLWAHDKLCINDQCLNLGDIVQLKRKDFQRRDGRWTHFDWEGDGRNYIRGETVQDGNLTVVGEIKGHDRNLKVDGNFKVNGALSVSDGCLRNGNRAVCMQADGNLVVYNGNRATWASGTRNR